MENIEALRQISSRLSNTKQLTKSQAKHMKSYCEGHSEYFTWIYERKCMNGAKDWRVKVSETREILVTYFYTDFDETIVCVLGLKEALIVCDALRRNYDLEVSMIPGCPVMTVKGRIDPDALVYHDPTDPPKPLPWWKRIRITRDAEPIVVEKTSFTRDTVIEDRAPRKQGRLRITIVPDDGTGNEDGVTFFNYLLFCVVLLASIGAAFALLTFVIKFFGS